MILKCPESGDHQRLVKMTGVKSLLSCDVDEKYEDHP